MGKVADFVIDAVTAPFKLTWEFTVLAATFVINPKNAIQRFTDSITDIAGELSEEFFAMIGIEDEDVISTNVSYSSLLQPLDLKARQLEIVLNQVIRDIPALDTIKQFNKTGNTVFNRIFSVDSMYHPKSVLTISAVNLEQAQAYVDIQYPGWLVQAVNTQIPTVDTIAEAYLFQVTDYNEVDASLTVGGVTYNYTSAILDTIQNIVVITVTNPDDATDIQKFYTNRITSEKQVIIRIANASQSNTLMISMGDLQDYVGSVRQQLDFLPTLPIKYNGTYVSTLVSSNSLNQQQIALSGPFGIDVSVIEDALKSNPDDDKIDDALVAFQVNPEKFTDVSVKYIFLMIQETFFDGGINPPTTDEGWTRMSLMISQDPYNSTLGGDLKYIKKRGNVTNIGKFTITRKDYTEYTSSKYVQDPIEKSDGSVSFTNNSVLVSAAEYIIKHQINDLYYIEMTIKNLTTLTVVSNPTIGGKAVLGDMFTPDSLRIPLSQYFIDMLTPSEKEQLYYETMELVVYALQVTHLKYYETEAFASFIQVIAVVVAVVIVVFTLGTASSLSAGLIALAEGLAVGLVAGIALKKILDSGAPNWLKVIAAVVYVIVMVYVGGGFDGTDLLMTAAEVVALTANAMTMYFQSEIEKQEAQTAQMAQQADMLQANLDEEISEQDLVGLTADEVANLLYGDQNDNIIVSGIFSYNTKTEVALGSILYDQDFVLGDQIERKLDLDSKIDIS